MATSSLVAWAPGGVTLLLGLAQTRSEVLVLLLLQSATPALPEAGERHSGLSQPSSTARHTKVIGTYREVGFAKSGSSSVLAPS
jgi:hypothetical protein